mgnify:CR=1 FL=1
MLPVMLKPVGFGTFDREDWSQYRERLNLPEEEALSEFYRQVVYDHFDDFNEHYPDFRIDEYDITVRFMSAQEANDQIRFLGGETLDSWGMQYDEFEKTNHEYIIFQTMSKSRTFPFPPIIVDPRRLNGIGWRECGRPLHLIEGTHRVSYLRRMLARGLVTPDSVHKFVLLAPK